ncbi:RNA polymerase sigma factor [Lewinella sp. LCG006]|uniref:RNA polymerase sigma factor n=1 Tax=Lewinella sp. LCG006 TaxID=3231911 RepID=UPI00345F3B9F
MAKLLPMGSPENLVECLHRKYHKMLLTYSISVAKRFSHLPLKGDDYLQMFYLKVITNSEVIFAGYQQHGVKYLMSIIKNEILNTNRKQQKRKIREEEFCQEKVLATGKDESAKEYSLEDLLRIVKVRLKSMDYEIFVHYLEGYQAKEIAKMVGLNHQTVGTRIFRIKKDLQAYLGDLGFRE